MDGEDVELLIGFYYTRDSDGANLGRRGGHYLTLTGVSWTDADMNGMIDDGEATMNFIDPDTGAPPANPAALRNQGGFLRTDYDVGLMTNCGTQASPVPCTLTNTFIEAAVSESPVPEPGTWLLLATGLLGLLGYGWRKHHAV